MLEDDSSAVFPANNFTQDSGSASMKCLQPCGIGYLDYLQLARSSVEECTVACRNWSSFYGGEGLGQWSQGAGILSPVSPEATDPPSTDASYSDVVGDVGCRNADASEMDCSSACDEVPGPSVRLAVKPVNDDLVPFLVRLNRVSAPDGLELSDDIVAEFEQLVDTLADGGFLETEPVSVGVDLAASDPSLRPEAVTIGCDDGVMTMSQPSFDGAQRRQVVVSETHGSRRCSEMIPADTTAPSVVTESMVGQNKRYTVNKEAPCIGNHLQLKFAFIHTHTHTLS